MFGMIRQAGVPGPFHLRMLLQVVGNFQCVLAMTLHAQCKGFQALEDHEGVER